LIAPRFKRSFDVPRLWRSDESSKQIRIKSAVLVHSVFRLVVTRINKY
jgi:hypothetical protein